MAASRFALDQARIDIPKARESLLGPLGFWNKIFSGDRNAAMSVIGPTADQEAAQTAAATRSQSEFAQRGGRRTLMLGEKPFSTVTEMNRNLLTARTGAADKVTGIGQIFAQLGLGEQSVGVSGNANAISGQLGLANLENQSNAITADAYRGVGQSIGAGLLALQKILNKNQPPTGGGGADGKTFLHEFLHSYNPESPTRGQ